MADYILFMHDDTFADDASWGPYLQTLRESGVFEGGSEIGHGRHYPGAAAGFAFARGARRDRSLRIWLATFA
jgi:hypothetical protein